MRRGKGREQMDGLIDGWMEVEWRWQTRHAGKRRMCSRKIEERFLFFFPFAGVDALMRLTAFVGIRSIDFSNSTRLAELNRMDNSEACAVCYV